MYKKLITVIVVACLVFTGCAKRNSNESDSNTATATEAATATATEAVTESTTEESVAEEESVTEEPVAEEETVFAIGDVATLGDWSITVTDVQITDSIVANSFGSYTPDEGNKYIQIFVDVTNNGKKSDAFLPTYSIYNSDVRTKLLFGDGYEFSCVNLLGYSNDLHDTTLNPLSTKSGEIAFDVLQTVVDSTEPLLLEFKCGKEYVHFDIRK